MLVVIANCLDDVPLGNSYRAEIIVLRNYDEGYMVIKNVTTMSAEIIIQVIANFETNRPLIMVDIKFDDVDWVKEGF